jgi:threonine dehydratase
MNKPLNNEFWREEVMAAHERIHPYILRTPLLYSHYLSRHTGGRVYLKMESEQYTGSFKARGAMNKLAWLNEHGDARPAVAASTGNHGLGMARAVALLGREGRIVVPENTATNKLEALRDLGALVEQHGANSLESEIYARAMAGRNNWIYVSPYNDAQVIAGQGTIAVEIDKQLPEAIDNVLVTVGGGGLVCGIAGYFKTCRPELRIIGCQPERSPEMARSVMEGRRVLVPPLETLSDASAGPFEENAITFPLCRRWVDEFLLTPEKSIGPTIRLLLEKERKLVEGAAAVAVAPLLLHPERWAGQTSVAIICGGNISVEKLRSIGI